MYSSNMRIVGSLLTIWCTLMLLACPGRNDNGVPNRASNSETQGTTSNTNAGSQAAPVPTREPCDEPTLQQKINRIQGEADQSTNDTELDDQRVNPKKWAILVEQDDKGYGIVIRVQGVIRNPSGGDTKLKKLYQHLDKLSKHMKRGCVGRVSFEADPAARSSRGFEWVACESPNQVCNDGSCRLDCSKRLDPTPSPSGSPLPSPSPSPTSSPAS